MRFQVHQTPQHFILCIDMKYLLYCFIIFSCQAIAAPFLVADPSCFSADNTNAACAAEYQYSSDDGASWQALESVVDGETIYIHHDLGTLTNGQYDWLVRAKNVWGISASVPFSFTAGEPGGIGSLRLQAE